jgi:protein-L-isoaspartate(D-aspartate) O-methyltransferase
MSFEKQRALMVERQLKARGLQDERLLAAFLKVPRHHFVPPALAEEAYADHPLPIGGGQTISQPYIVGLMVHHLRLQGHERVLEIGTGSGYETAILAELALEVYSVERLPELLHPAAERLLQAGAGNVHLSAGNGSLGWPEHAPYDAILVSAAAPRLPRPLLDQLGDPGRMVLPLGPAESQTLILVERRDGTVVQTELASCVFVPLLGDHGWPPADKT